MKIDWNKIKEFLRHYLLNKYVITLLVFAILFIFIGDQSLLSRIKRNREIHELQRDIKEYQGKIEDTQEKIQDLESSTENLERYARERYLMHADNEDVFLVDEE